ncbi:MAG: Trm112 family protein [Lysobacterales bacterium]
MRANKREEFDLALENKLLEILACPVSNSALLPLSLSLQETLNRAISGGNVLYVDGSPVQETLDQGLITEDKQVIYRVENGIPQLLPDRGIGTTQLD